MITTTRHTIATVAGVVAVATVLTIGSAAAPTTADAHRPALAAAPSTSVDSLDVGLEIAHRKAARAQYLVDHALELFQGAASR